MSETALIALGVAVFAMTIVAVLIYFYSVVSGLAAAEAPSTGVVGLGVTDPDV